MVFELSKYLTIVDNSRYKANGIDTQEFCFGRRTKPSSPVLASVFDTQLVTDP